MSMETPMTPAAALTALRDAELAQSAARLDLETKLRDAFPQEYAAVEHADTLVKRCKDNLIAAIRFHGALEAEVKNPIGWAAYSSAPRREYASVAEWKAALTSAGLEAFIPTIVTEGVNEGAVDDLRRSSGNFHLATEALITTKLSKPVLRYKWHPDPAKAAS